MALPLGDEIIKGSGGVVVQGKRDYRITIAPHPFEEGGTNICMTYKGESWREVAEVLLANGYLEVKPRDVKKYTSELIFGSY